jgi:dipeptidyl aminopeptidase/acylaminoacyl peptidase
LHYDQKKRELLIQTAGRNPEINPYYRDICKVNIDTCELTTLVSDNFDHMVTHPRHQIALGLREKNPAMVVRGDVNGVSPNGEFIVTTKSRVDTAPVTVLFDRNGCEVMTVETADVSNLPEGWAWPEPVMLKDAEGKHDIYGVVYRPPGFSADKSYPVIDYAWTMRGTGTVPVGAFHLDPTLGYIYMYSIALASLGFIVVSIEGRGTPFRGKHFQDYYADDIAGEHVLDDHIAGIKQLAQRYPSIDLNRAGIIAVEQSPFAVYGAVHHSDFFKVAVQHCFLDPRYLLADHGEMHFNQAQEINDSNNGLGKTKNIEDFVGLLTARLLLIQGMLSFAVGGTFRLVEALEKANKDFDMICLPNMSHQMTSYTIRREWDYLVTHLQGIEPPKEFSLTVGEFLVEEKPEPSQSEFLEMLGGTADEKEPA